MRSFNILLVVSFLLFLSTAVLSQQLMSNIITFANKESRQTYIDHLKQQEPNVRTELINHVFIGLITHHPAEGTLHAEIKRLDRMQAKGEMSILSFERDQVMRATEFDAETIRQPSPPWHLDRIGQRSLPLDNSFEFDSSHDPINVYVADTGVRISHSEFEGRAHAGYSAVSGAPAGQDGHGHGSHCAGLIAGRTYGTVKNANIFDVRVLGSDGSGSTSGIIKGMDWVAKNHQKPAVINMSLGGGYSSSLNNAIASLFRAGVLPVVAAGNENTDACTKSPASAPDAVTVGATTKSDQRSSFSNYGRCVDIYSPGSNILSVGIDSDTDSATMSGTSMASPITAGVAAYIYSKNPNDTPAQITSKLLQLASTDVNSDIRPFVFYQPEEGSPQPDPEPQPEPEPECPSGYTGPSCDVPICFNIPATRSDVCSSRGKCTAPNTCSCDEGFSGEKCEEEKPAEPKKPGMGKLLAFINGSPLKKVTSTRSAVLDASLSHATPSLQKEMCWNGDTNSKMHFKWSCNSEITNSAANPFCNGAKFSNTGRLTLSQKQLASLQGTGPVIFTATVELYGYVSEARAVVVVE